MDNHQRPVRLHHRLLSWAISAMLATQPLLPAVAASLTPSAPGTQIDRAGNGVPVVNIATPNGAGISHNQFKDYNVGKEGIILNNATGQLNQTQLGGLIQNNPKLKAGQEARGIINEVNGGSRSQLQGYTEVAGKAANVMVANPYGITCNGCGFINTPNVTLTTGKPVFDAAGNLLALDVKKGAISVEGQGLNASQADALSIIARATEVNAEIHAKDLNVIAGANRVGADGKVTAIAGEGVAPAVAVDTGMLGGMYANRIRLVSSEKGVGVNLGNLNARQGDISLDSSGKLTVKNSLASGSLAAKGESVTLAGEHKASGPMTLNAQSDVTLSAAQLASDKDISLSGSGKMQISGSRLTAGNDINLSARDLVQDGTSQGDAARDIRVAAAESASTQGKLTAGRDLTLNGGRLTNSGMLASKGTMQLQGSQLVNSGLLQSGGTATLKGDYTTIDGAISGAKGLSIQADTLATAAQARLQTDGAMNLAARQAMLSGTQAAKGTLTVTADSLQHNGKSSAATVALNGKAIVNGGTIVAPALAINSDSLTNGGLLQGSRTLNLVAALLNNQRGGTMATDGSLTLAVPQLSNGGLVAVGGDLDLSGNSLTNGGEINAANLTSKVANLANQQNGLLLANGNLALAGKRLDNAGQLAADTQSLSFDSLSNQGAIQGNRTLSLTAKEVSNSGTLLAGGDLTVAADALTNSGTLQGANLLALNVAALNHLDGVLLSGGSLDVQATKLTSAGLMQGKTLNLATGDWINTGNALSEQTAILSVSHLLNNKGKILGQNGVNLSAASLDNSGWLVAKAVNFQGDLVNSGLIQGSDGLDLSGDTLTNRLGGQLLSGGNHQQNFKRSENQGTLQGKSLLITADEWTNGGFVQAQDSLRANVKGTLNNDGTLLSQNLFELHAARIINQGSLAADKLSLTAPSLINSGLLQGNSSLLLTIPQIHNLKNGRLISGGALNLALDSLENEGLLQVNDDLSLSGETFTNRGSILANALSVDLSGALQNLENGQLIARSDARFALGSLNNSGVLAAEGLSLRSGNASNGGVIQGASHLDITAGRLDNLAAGKILSGGSLKVDSGTTTNAGTWQGKTIEADLAALTNTGEMNGLDWLTGRIAGDLSNSGQLWSQGDLFLEAAGLSNSGKIVAKNLALSADSLLNDGLWQGAEKLTVIGDTLATGSGSRTLAGGLLGLNAGQLGTGGTLQGQSVDITAGSWRHEGSLLGLDGLNANVSGTLNNSGDLLSHGDMQITARTLTSSGSLLSEGDMHLAGSSLENKGALQGKNLTLNQASINNSGSAIGLASLTLEARDTLAARMQMAAPLMTLVNGGQLLTGGTLTVNGGDITHTGSWQGQRVLLAAQSLQNSGAIQSADALQITLAGNLNSTSGSKITASGNAVLSALNLTNQGQWLAKNLILKGGSLANGGEIGGVEGLTVALSGAFTQQQESTLLTAGKLTLEAASVDNRGRIQGAELGVKSGTLINNGRLQGDNALTLSLTGELNNGAAGSLLSQKDLTVTTPSLINYGILQGGTVARLSGMNIARNDGKVLSGGELNFASASLTNNGWLQAGQLVLNATTAVNNGTILAEQQGTIAGNSLTNAGLAQADNLAVNYQQLTNGGTLLGKTGLSVSASQVNHQAAGKLFSGGNLTLTSAGLDQLGQIVALGNLTLKLTNAFTAKNVLAAGNALSVSSDGAIINNAVMQGQAVNLAAGGALNNNGQITTGSGASTLSGNQIAMNAAGSLQAGGDVALNSRGDITVDGFLGTAGNLTLNAAGSLLNTALLYAGNNMYLLANSIKNQRGDILAGNSLWMQRDMAGTANAEVVNTSGSIETQRGDITVKTGHLLNTREGLSVKEATAPGTAFPGLGDATLNVHYSLLPTGSYGYYTTNHQEEATHCGGADGGCTIWDITTYHYAPFEEYATQKFALSQTSVEVYSTGGAGRIASGQHLNITAGSLENQASNILAAKNIILQGTRLSNQSWESGTKTESLVYQYGNGSNTQPGYATNVLPENGLPNKNNNYNKYNQLLSFYLVGRETTHEAGEIYRSVIQAGGNVVANFTSDISNTTTTANAGGVSHTITAPALNTLSHQSISSGVQKEKLANADKAAVGSPLWNDQLQNALQQINGGSGLEGSGGSIAGLDNYAVNGSGDANLGSAAQLENGGAQGANLKDPKPHQNSGVDTSAYPLPSGNNGYFVTATDPNSPYLITTNPRLDGLGQLDQSLFGDLYDLMGMKPGSAPRETNGAYTDQNKFLGSAYFLDRLNLHPEYDYRFLGDAAFDTRYVSNYVLNQTGSRYINGIGSDLDQMQYLIDSAARAQDSLGLQFGVALTAAQIAALDKSIIWWEAATVNGQTVMVPKVYLSPKDVTVNNGSVIAGNNVTLNGGSITNNGSTLTANNNLSLDSQNSISNLNNGLMNAGGNLQLNALGDINNIGSTIAGKTVALDSLDGSINNITLAETWSLGGGGKYGSVGMSGTTLGNTASITSLDSLSLSAGQDINITGANVTAGGSLLMDAWGDIAVSANQVTSSYSQSGFRGKDATSNESVTSQGSTITAGGSLGMQAGNDLTLAASAVNAGGNAALIAGNDLNLNAAQTSESASKGKGESHSTDIDRTTVTSGGDLTLAAGRDITSQAAGIAAEGDVAMQAGRDVNLLAQETTEGSSYTAKKKVEINESVRQQGTEIASGGNTKIIAGRDVNAEAAQVTASGDIGLGAGRDINLTTATESDYHFKEETKTKSGFLSKKTTHTVEEDSATREAGTLLSGDNVTVSAGNNLLVKGSAVVGDGDVSLSAGNNVDIVAATNTDSTYRLNETKKSGLMGTGGIGITVGTAKSRHEVNEDGTTQSQSASTVGSTGGNVSIIAGGQAHISGSDLIAGKDMSITGDSVVIDPGHDRRTRDESFEQKQSGLTVALSGVVGSAINSAVSAAQSAKDESDGRLAALQATKAALSGVQAAQGAELAQVSGDPNNGMGVSLSLTTQKSKSEQHQVSDTVSGSTLNAGENLSIKATGRGDDAHSGDIAIGGSQLKAGGDTTLDAANDILLLGAANTQQTSGKNSSGGGGVGVSIGGGSNGAGISIFANVNAAKGKDKGNGTAWSETTLDSGGNVNISSGRDTVLNGAQVSGDRVIADVGRDLLISSQQDSNDYNSKQTSVAAGGSFTFGSMTGSGYINASQDKMRSEYDSVVEQSGIYAGKGGFDITVGNHTQLDGAVIASTATADKNHLDTGTLGFTDIHNEADFKTEHSGVSLSGSGSFGGDQFKGNMPGGVVSVAGNSGHAEGTTQSAVADGSITIRDRENQQQDVAGLSRDTEHANDSLSPIFDKEKEQKRLQTVQAISEIGGQAADIARTQGEINARKTANEKMQSVTPEERDAAHAQWQKENPGKTPTDKNINDQIYQEYYTQAFNDSGFGTGGIVQRGIQAATAALQGLAGGNIAGALAGASAPELANLLKATEKDPVVNTIAHAILGGAVAMMQGNSAAAGAAGAASAELAAHAIMATMYPGKTAGQLTEEEKQTVSTLATISAGMAGGIAGDSTSGAAGGAQAGKNAVENNLLGGNEDTQTKFVQEHGKDIASCATNPTGAACQRGQALNDALTVALPAGLGGGVLIAATPEIAAILKTGVESCVGALALCINNLGLQASEIIVPGGVGAGGAVGIGKTAAEATAAKAEAAAANIVKNSQITNNSKPLNVAEQIGILRDAAKGNKGNFGLGNATANEANVLGEAWVGPGYRISKDGTSWVSADGLRVYRPPSAKPNSTQATTGVQANFEQKLAPGERPISNGHLDITK
ncbi:MAG TPA: hemagglutinin repeat-containing protein [Buttiauxella sp.]|jgi:filamentous hemagglutinin